MKNYVMCANRKLRMNDEKKLPSVQKVCFFHSTVYYMCCKTVNSFKTQNVAAVWWYLYIQMGS